MSSSSYLLLFISLAIPCALGLILLLNKKNHTELYSEGVRNENDGHYDLALHNYEDALSEIRKHNLHDRFSEKITQRIKILRTTMDYEKNFQHGQTQPATPKRVGMSEMI